MTPNVVKLKEHYQKGDEAGEENMTKEDLKAHPSNYSGSMWFIGSEHVGLFSYRNQTWYVIHASSTYDNVRWDVVTEDSDWWKECGGFGAPPDEGCGEGCN